MLARGKFSRSNARHATSSASVESSPPDTPMTTRSRPVDCSRVAQALHLDVERLVTVAIQPRGIVRHEGESRHIADQAAVGEVGLRGEADAAGGLFRMPHRKRDIVEGAHALAFQPQAFNIHVRDGHLIAGRETVALRQALAVLVNHRLSVPREIGGGFTGA